MAVSQEGYVTVKLFVLFIGSCPIDIFASETLVTCENLVARSWLCHRNTRYVTICHYMSPYVTVKLFALTVVQTVAFVHYIWQIII